MLALCAMTKARQLNNISFDIELPTNLKMRRLFINTNWAHYISPHLHEYRNFEGYAQVPATYFSNHQEQYAAVTKIVDVILTHIDGIQKSDFAAFEWAANEMTDNILNHSITGSGFVQVSKLRKFHKKISMIICDIGIGIPDSLRSGLHTSMTDAVALSEAIKEGVTRDKSVGQGNGLYGSHKVCPNSGGMLKIRSGYAILTAVGDKVETETTSAPFKGTLIASEIDFSKKGLLENALKFDGKVHETLSRIEAIYEDEFNDLLTIKIIDCTKSFGSRASGSLIQKKIYNLLEMHPEHKVNIDFSGAPLITSSFADEILGKLLIKIGKEAFFKKIKLSGMDEINKKIISRSLTQRERDMH
ncbi:STAS-like domain-containing protein [Chromobacterium sp. Beijing]|uniref:STAS-like domain-containing protein n=1 Tax=Chromobacterium sp. Beijing TaxID=2735795 RepID=UPI001F40B538|nr:DUF4325 domain-containing protein [Chromobacterium sp. Beijing]UJB30500.1 DUF4325 domain-containing protein [Chromobacterium sp. Beijing]